jgi:hypothetical protein
MHGCNEGEDEEPYLAHRLYMVLYMLVKYVVDIQALFCEDHVDNLYNFSSPEPYAHGIIHGIIPLGGLKEIESALSWAIP